MTTSDIDSVRRSMTPIYPLRPLCTTLSDIDSQLKLAIEWGNVHSIRRLRWRIEELVQRRPCAALKNAASRDPVTLTKYAISCLPAYKLNSLDLDQLEDLPPMWRRELLRSLYRHPRLESLNLEPLSLPTQKRGRMTKNRKGRMRKRRLHTHLRRLLVKEGQVGPRSFFQEMNPFYDPKALANASNP